MPTGQVQRLTLSPTPVSAPFSIPVCFRAHTHPCLSSFPPSLIVPLVSDSQPVLQKFQSSAAEVAPRAQRIRSPALRPQRRLARNHPGGNEAGLPRYASFLSRLPVAFRLLIIHHSPYSLCHIHRESPRTRVKIPLPNANAVVLPRTRNRKPMKTLITPRPLNPARQRRRRGQVDRASKSMIDTNSNYYLSYFEAITIAQERLISHVQDPFVHNLARTHTP